MLSCSGVKKFQADQGYQQKAWAYHPGPQQIDSQGAAWPVYSNRVAPSKAAADVSDWTIARRNGPQPARPYGTPYTRSALPPIVPNGGLLSMSRSDEYRRFAAECLKMAQSGARTKPSYLPANGASVVCPRRER